MKKNLLIFLIIFCNTLESVKIRKKIPNNIVLTFTLINSNENRAEGRIDEDEISSNQEINFPLEKKIKEFFETDGKKYKEYFNTCEIEIEYIDTSIETSNNGNGIWCIESPKILSLKVPLNEISNNSIITIQMNTQNTQPQIILTQEETVDQKEND